MSLEKPEACSIERLSVEPLCLHPQHVDTLAHWHFDEWQHLYEHWSLSVAREDLLRQTSAAVPTTLVALHGDDAIGSVSLLHDDLAGYEHLTPWLASLYVRSDWRGRGIGGKLVAAVLQQARALGISRLYLFTPAQRDFYIDKGFRDFGHAAALGEPVTIMVWDL